MTMQVTNIGEFFLVDPQELIKIRFSKSKEKYTLQVLLSIEMADLRSFNVLHLHLQLISY